MALFIMVFAVGVEDGAGDPDAYLVIMTDWFRIEGEV